VVLFLVELKHPGVGLPLAGGIACLILGGLPQIRSTGLWWGCSAP
jgi:membrane-bound ClpP family serine protease